MYDNITPDQWIYGLLTSLIAFGVLSWLFYRYTRPRDEAPHTMSSPEDESAAAGGTEPVHVPVPGTGTNASTSEVVPLSPIGEKPDTTAANGGTEEWELPRISTRMSDASIVVMLAAQRTPEGKWRFSGNKILDLVGGNRAAVQAQVKAVQQGTPPPEYRELDEAGRPAELAAVK